MGVEDQKVTFDRYLLVPRTLIFLTRGDEILLLKGAPHKRLWAGRYNGIGGHVQAGETPLAAAHRELAEETGLRASLWLCGVVTIDTGPRAGVVLFVFRGEPQPADAPLLASPEGQPVWVRRDAWAQLPLVEDLPTLLPKVLAARPENPPFFAQYAYDDEGRLQICFERERGAFTKSGCAPIHVHKNADGRR